ncbi:RNA polymerase sigma factor [bacterium]|nr:RNA polymerase sigma factor [bacterium]
MEIFLSKIVEEKMQEITKNIIIQASKGDIGAFEIIYKTSADFVYSIALSITKNIDTAEDITQEVFIKIYKNLKKFQFRSTFKTWIYRIAINTAINDYKKRSKEMGKRDDFELALKTHCVNDITEEIIGRKDKERQLLSFLDTLNKEQRTCIILREIERLSYKEISEVLKININTVRSRLKRARIALLACRKKGVIKDELRRDKAIIND